MEGELGLFLIEVREGGPLKVVLVRMRVFQFSFSPCIYDCMSEEALLD